MTSSAQTSIAALTTRGQSWGCRLNEASSKSPQGWGSSKSPHHRAAAASFTPESFSRSHTVRWEASYDTGLGFAGCLYCPM